MTPWTLRTQSEASIGVFVGHERAVLSVQASLSNASPPVSLTLAEAEDLILGLRRACSSLRAQAAMPPKAKKLA